MDGQPVTATQRRALFAAGRARRLDIDGLRALSPDGRMSKLTRAQAADLLTRLNQGTDHEHPRRPVRGPRRPKGVYAFVSDAQRRKIESLRIDGGWTHEGLDLWQSERHHDDGRPMTRVVESSADDVAVIELLKAVLAQSRIKTRRDGSTVER